MKRLLAAGVILAAAIVATGCSSSAGNPPDVTPTNPSTGSLPGSATGTPAASPVTAALFQPAQGIFPFPNDLYFAGTVDGTINIQPANGLIPNQVGLNALDGWSTTAPIRIRFGGPLNATSFSAANIRVYQVTVSNTNKAVTGFTRALTYGTEFTAGLATDAGVGPTIMEIVPKVPLTPSSGTTAAGVGYLVLITNGVKMASGAAATADTDYATIKTALGNGPTYSPAPCAALPNAPMQGACGFTASHLTVANATGVTTPSIIMSFHFTTVATRDTMLALGATINASPAPAIALAPPPPGVPASGIPLNTINPALPSFAGARFGTVTVPYYSYIPSSTTDSAVLRTAWSAAVAVGGERNLTRFNPLPQLVANKAIPLLVIVPNAVTKPVAGWPVIIFEHGITRDRSDAFALAQAFASQGWVIVAVDQPLHGITSATNPLYQVANEQTFNLDLVNNTTGATGSDGVIDSTGTHFINLTYPLASRDNLRQAVVNLLALTRALPNLDISGDTVGDIDPTRIAFVGQSLGSIAGITYGAALPAVVPVRSLALSVPGGGVAALLRDSPTFGPRIDAGLAAQGLIRGTTLYAQYFRDVQNIVDAGDPLNFVTLSAQQRAVYFQQVVGGSGSPASLPDQVIPNSATQRLIDAIVASGQPFPRASVGVPANGDGYVNFIAGTHGSLLSPGATPIEGLTTVEMQTEAVTFTLTPSNTINPVNATVVAP